MTPSARAAVHRLAGAFSRLSLAAELVVQAKPGPARAALVERMEAARRASLQDFAAAMEELSPPEPSSADPSAAPHLPAAPPSTPPRAEQAPVTSTTPRLAPDAGGGRPAVLRARRGTVAECALQLLATSGWCTAEQVAAKMGRGLQSVRATMHELGATGRLKYCPPARRGLSGCYVLPGASAPELPPAPPPKHSMAPRPARLGIAPAGDEAAELARYGVRRVPVDQAPPRAPERAVPGVHLSPADFFAHKEPLPKNRPLWPRYG